MQWEEERCIVSGDNRAWQHEGEPRTVIELWCRSKRGHSLLLLVNGLSPYVEISDPRTNETNKQPSLSLDSVSTIKTVQGKPESIGLKLSQDGVIRPHYRIYVRDTRFVRSVRKNLEEFGWTVTSADIPFFQRLLLDCDLGPHILAQGEVLWAGERAPAEARDEATTDRATAEGRISEVGGVGLYPTDMGVTCALDGLSKTEPFRTPFVTFSFDLETSIKSNRILCAAAVIDRGGKRTEHPFKGEEGDIM